MNRKILEILNISTKKLYPPTVFEIMPYNSTVMIFVSILRSNAFGFPSLTFFFIVDNFRNPSRKKYIIASNFEKIGILRIDTIIPNSRR